MIPLKKEIKTANHNVFQQVLINIYTTYNWASQNAKAKLHPYDLTQQQYNVLRILKNQYPSPVTVNLIKAMIIDKTSDVSRIVDRLIQKDFVDKAINSYDKRAADVVISTKGLALMKKMDKAIDFSKFISGKLNKEEAAQLNILLDKLRG